MKRLLGFMLFSVLLSATALTAQSVGEKSPNFSFKDSAGKVYTLDSFKGKYVYIDFWATWCPPCRMEIPYLKKMEHAFKDNKKIVFVSISVDQDKAVWNSFLAKNEMSGIQIWANPEGRTALASFYNMQSIPRFVVLDPDGKLVNANAPRPSDAKTADYLQSLAK